MEKELISVIVPCYNVSNFIEDCYISLKNQTYENFEVIFVNDGSKDDTLQKIKTYCEDNARFRYVDQENKGLSGARNTGIAESKGKYLCFIDSDDAVSPRFLENMYFAIKRTDADFATCTRKFTKETFSSPRIFIIILLFIIRTALAVYQLSLQYFQELFACQIYALKIERFKICRKRMQN